MAIEKKSNEYGTYLYQEFLEAKQTANGRIVVFIHDQYDNPDIFNKFAEQLKFYDYYSIAYPGDELFEVDYLYKNSYNFTCSYVRDLILSFNAKEIIVIAQGTAAPIALFLANILSEKITKISLINPFTSKSSVETLRWVSTLPRNVEDMKKVVDRMYFSDDKQIFKRGLESPAIVSRMKNVCHHFADISNYVENLCTIKVLDELRIYEENIRCPTQIILGNEDVWISPQEGLIAFNNYPFLSRVEIPKAKHYPLHDQELATINYLMKFIIKDSNLYSEDKLPNKYVYRYLDDEWKQYYRGRFQETLSSREQEEYAKKIKEYESGLPTIAFKNEEYGQDYLNEVAFQQTQSLDMIYNQVEQQYHQTKAWEEEYKRQTKPTIQLDFSMPANTIVMNAQGYEIYHDGRGQGYYRVPNGDWKKFKRK